MKHIVRVFVFNVFGLWFASQLLPTLILSDGWQALFQAGFALSMLMLIVKPLLKILFIPINLITFGLLSWFINVIVIYLLTIFVPTVVVREWTFPGISYFGFVIPSVRVSYMLALIVSSLLVTFITNLLHSLSEE